MKQLFVQEWQHATTDDNDNEKSLVPGFRGDSCRKAGGKPGSFVEDFSKQKKKKILKTMPDDLSPSRQDAIYLTDRAKLIFVPAQVNGKDVKALVDSGASITVVSKNEIPELNITKD
ncbi:hypothetical protein HPB49_022034 [Dermacentor silvarum]|uniref:Uncharacterized protein n=1 Tax=Dermacentor silvarum TaxID=543639 RepID=A0ACB8CBR0_DERSI|nr:hypothetical protein HPB49_022034 [Dermacentor silvarum]